MTTPIIDGDLWMAQMLADQQAIAAAQTTLIAQMTELIARITPMSTAPFDTVTTQALPTLDVSAHPHAKVDAMSEDVTITGLVGVVNGGQYLILVNGIGEIIPGPGAILADTWDAEAPGAQDYCLYSMTYDGTAQFWSRIYYPVLPPA